MSDPISWLGALIPSLTPQMEVAIFVNVVPILLFISVFIHILMVLLLPKSGWIRLKARLRREGVLVQLFTDEGFERTELMKSDLGQGILSGNPISYIFTPRPSVFKKGDITKGEKDVIDISTEMKANLDEALSHRASTDTGKPLYIGYVGKSVAVTPRLLKIIKDVQGGKKLRLKKKADDEEKEENIPVKLLELLDPRALKLYIGSTFSVSLIESIKAENERKGYLRKPAPIEFLSKNPISIVLIILILLVGIAMFSGQLDILALLGMGGT